MSAIWSGALGEGAGPMAAVRSLPSPWFDGSADVIRDSVSSRLDRSDEAQQKWYTILDAKSPPARRLVERRDDGCLERDGSAPISRFRSPDAALCGARCRHHRL